MMVTRFPYCFNFLGSITPVSLEIAWFQKRIGSKSSTVQIKMPDVKSGGSANCVLVGKARSLIRKAGRLHIDPT